jgi:hypothetical protein
MNIGSIHGRRYFLNGRLDKMDKQEITALASEIETRVSVNEDVLQRVSEVLQRELDNKSISVVVNIADFSDTDRVIFLVDAVLPGWTILLSGTAIDPDGHWKCTLRRSASRDNDEFIGTSRGPKLSHALAAALLKVISYHPQV